MQVKVSKSVLFNFLKNALNENSVRSDIPDGSGNFIGTFNMPDEEGPIEAAPHMSNQLSVAKPPVEDPDYVPGSLPELSTAASRMMEEVPFGQIEFVYRFLHKLLDMALDKEDEDTGQFLSEQKVIFENLDDFQKRAVANAAQKALAGESIDSLAADLAASLDMDVEEAEEAIASAMMSGFESPAAPEPAAPQQQKSAEAADDIKELPEYIAASNKEQFLAGYSDGADAAVGLEVQEPADMSPDYLAGYEKGISEYEGQLREPETPERGPDASDEEYFGLDSLDLSSVPSDDKYYGFYRLLPALYKLLVAVSFEAEREGFKLISAGIDNKEVQTGLMSKFGINYTNNFVPANLMKASFTVEKKEEVAAKVLSRVRSQSLPVEGAERFNRLFDSALEASDMSDRDAQAFMARAIAINLEENRLDYDYMPYEEKRDYVFMTNFAELTVFKPGQKLEGKKKPYQQSTSTNFRRRVTEDQTEDIVSDFLDKLSKKYLKDGKYRVKSGREYFEYDAVEFGKLAEEYARNEIQEALTAQAEGNIKIDEFDLDSDDLSQLEEPAEQKELTDAELAQKLGVKLKDAKDFETMAPFFGFTGSSGLRQWYLKFAERQFKMLVLSLKSGGEGFGNMHKQALNALISNKFEGKDFLLGDDKDNFINTLKDMASKYKSPKKGTMEEVYKYILDKAIPQIESVRGEADIAEDADQKEFFYSLGGQLVKNINGSIFKKTLTQIDNSWTEVVAAEIDARVPDVDEKKARGLAEYWTGKKEEPDYENMTKAAKNLMKYDIGPELYAKIKQESEDWFEDAVLFEFGKEGSTTGEYRDFIINKLVSTLENKKAIEKEVISAMNEIHEDSSMRQAVANLSDYEVEEK